MASPLTLPGSSGVITGTGATGGIVNIRGFAARSGAAACSVNIRQGGVVGGDIILPIYLAANQMAGDVWSATIVAHGPLYCELVTGTPDAALIFID